MKLPPQMTSADVRLLFKLMGKGRVRFVGGCVRNVFWNMPVVDIDLATVLPPDKVSAILSGAGVKVVPTGIDHGTVTAVINGVGYEITTLRRDVETDGRRAVVAYTTDWAEDAARRDFTMNALYADLDGTIYDPLGRGLRDLGKRTVIFVGDAETRIQEDYLRILRFFRFHILYGRGAPDKDALAACAKFASKIETLSRERVTQELTKMMVGERPHHALSLMRDYRILPALLGKNYDSKRVASLAKIQESALGASEDMIFCSRLFTVLGFQFRESGKLSNYLILNKKQISILNDLKKIKIDTMRFDTRFLRKNLYAFGRASTLTALTMAGSAQNVSQERFKKFWAVAQETDIPVFPISGKDLLSLGIPPGPRMGAKLAALEKLWVQSDFALGRAALLSKISVS